MARQQPDEDRERRSEEELQGSPPREIVTPMAEADRRAVEEREEYRATGPALTGGDPDADWKRPDVGEEMVGGSVATPDQDVVDELGEALGVPRAPDDEVTTSGEILEGRDRHRWEEEDTAEE